MSFAQVDVRHWLGWSGLKNEAVTFRGKAQPDRRFHHLSYQTEENRIQVVLTTIDAYVGSNGRIDAISRWEQRTVGSIIPLSSNVALTTFGNESFQGTRYKVRPTDGKDCYLWFPHGIEAAKDGPHLTCYPDLHLLHVHWKDYQLYVFKARIPPGSALETFYPETYAAYALREHPECWLGYWTYVGDYLVNLTDNRHMHVWTNTMEMPKPEEFFEFLAKRLTRTVGGNYKSLFTLRALEATCTT